MVQSYELVTLSPPLCAVHAHYKKEKIVGNSRLPEQSRLEEKLVNYLNRAMQVRQGGAEPLGAKQS